MKTRILLGILILSLLNLDLKAQIPIRIYLVGDTSCASHKVPDWTGWGQILPNYFMDNVSIYNYARNGKSSKQFISEGRWSAICTQLKMGYFVFIQLGNNDEKIGDTERFSEPYGEFSDNLHKFIKEAKEKGATTVLITPIARHKYKNGELVDTHKDYSKAIRKVAAETGAYLVDMDTMTTGLAKRIGEKRYAQYFYWGEMPKRNEKYIHYGRSDCSHFGATEFARMIASSIKSLNIPILSEYILND